jgi:hypothetical protein
MSATPETDRDDLINLIDARTFRGVNGPAIHALADEIIAAGWVNANRLIEMARAEGSADECKHNFETICTGCGIEAHDCIAGWAQEPVQVPDNSALEALADRMAAKREAATHLLVVTRARELEGQEVLLTVRGVVDHSRGWTTLLLDGIPAVRLGDQFGPRAYLVDIRVVDQ